MPRMTTLDKFLSPDDPAFESNGWQVTVSEVRHGHETRVHLLDAKELVDAVAKHQADERWPSGAGLGAVVGYVGRFDTDGSFIGGEYLQVRFSGDPGFDEAERNRYYLHTPVGRKPAYATYKKLIEAAQVQAPKAKRRRAEEAAEKSAVESARRAASQDLIRSLADDQDVKAWVWRMKADLAESNRQIRAKLRTLMERSQEMLDRLDARPDAHLSSSFNPDARMMEELHDALATRAALLATMTSSPFWVLFKEMVDA